MGSGPKRNIVYRHFGIIPEACTDFRTSKNDDNDDEENDLNELINRYRQEFYLPNLELAIRTCVSRLLVLHREGAV